MFFQKYYMDIRADICIYTEILLKYRFDNVAHLKKRYQSLPTDTGISTFNKACNILYHLPTFPSSFHTSLFLHYTLVILVFLYILQCPFLTHLQFPLCTPSSHLCLVHFYSLPAGSFPWLSRLSPVPVICSTYPKLFSLQSFFIVCNYIVIYMNMTAT